MGDEVHKYGSPSSQDKMEKEWALSEKEKMTTLTIIWKKLFDTNIIIANVKGELDEALCKASKDLKATNKRLYVVESKHNYLK